jgi:hypothetical protein
MFDLKEAEETWERLKAYPNLLSKVKTMLDLIEKKQVESADDFEEALIPEVRGLGKEIVKTWATYEESLIRENLKNDGAAHHSKKKSTGIPPSGK